MSARLRVWLAGAAGVFLLLLPFGTFVKTNYRDASFVSANFARFFLETAPLVAAAVAGAAVLLYLATSRRAAHPLSRTLLTACAAFFLLFYYHYPYLELFPEGLAAWVPAGSFLVLVALLAFFVFKLARHPAVLIAVLLFAAANLAVTLPRVVRMAADVARPVYVQEVDLSEPGLAAGAPRPNVYYFILDAYPGVAALRQTFDYANEPFIEAMEGRGFYHADSALASYNRTVFTLGAIFAQDYFATGRMTTEEGKDRMLTYPPLLKAPEPPSLVADAGRLGYETYLVGNYWAACKGPWVACHAEAKEDAYLVDSFWSATPGPALAALAWGGGAERVPDVDAIGKLLARLQEAGAPQRPTFTLVHHLSPHPPYLYNADCSLRGDYSLDLELWSDNAKPLFLNNLACTNTMVARISDAIIARDPDAIIVFQGDHGSAFNAAWDRPFDAWPPAWVLQRSSILNLVRLPARCHDSLVPELDNVHTIRAVMGCVAGRAPDPDDVRGYVTAAEDNPEHGEIRRVDPASLRAVPEAPGN